MPFSSGDPLTDPLSPVALTTLLTALGLSSTAGLRAYLPLLILGIASDIRGPDGVALLPVQDQFHILGNPLVLGVLAILVVLEFLADKIPGVDHISDIVHTIIRPAAGALIMAGSANTLSDESKIVAAVVGALVALATHFMKAGTRAAVTSTTAGVGNPFASLLEDILVVGVILLLVLAPIVPMVRSHHERWAGGGYPDGLEGDAIPLGAAVIALADAFDTITTARPWASAHWSSAVALVPFMSELKPDSQNNPGSAPERARTAIFRAGAPTSRKDTGSSMVSVTAVLAPPLNSR